MAWNPTVEAAKVARLRSFMCLGHSLKKQG
jgi:hypothetical protein